MQSARVFAIHCARVLEIIALECWNHYRDIETFWIHKQEGSCWMKEDDSATDDFSVSTDRRNLSRRSTATSFKGGIQEQDIWILSGTSPVSSHKSVPVPNRYAHFNLQLFNIVVPFSLNLTNNRMLICLKYASIPTENEYGYKGVLCFE